MPRAIQFFALSEVQHRALCTLKKDMSILIVPAGKRTTTVILDKADFIEKAKQPLRDIHHRPFALS